MKVHRSFHCFLLIQTNILFIFADFKHALVLEPQNKVANLAEKRLRKLMS